MRNPVCETRDEIIDIFMRICQSEADAYRTVGECIGKSEGRERTAFVLGI